MRLFTMQYAGTNSSAADIALQDQAFATSSSRWLLNWRLDEQSNSRPTPWNEKRPNEEDAYGQKAR